MASLGVGLERLRQLGWERRNYFHDQYNANGVIIALLVIAMILYLVFKGLVGLPLSFCVPLWLLSLFFFSVISFDSKTRARRMEGMLTKRVTEPHGSALRAEVEVAMKSVGFQHSRTAPSQRSALAVSLTSDRDYVYWLPDLGAELIVGSKTEIRDHLEATTLYFGPVTADNVGGLVRFAEALENYNTIGRT